MSCLVSQAAVFGESENFGYAKYASDSSSQIVELPSKIEAVINSPVLVLRGVKTVLKKAFVWIETYHVPDKAVYIYDKITEYDIYPVKTVVGDRSGDPQGVGFKYGIYPVDTVATTSHPEIITPLTIQYLKDFSLKDNELFDSVNVNTWAKDSFSRYKDYGSRLTFSNLFGSQWYLNTGIRYEDLPREDYFGKGNNLSIADGSAFSLEETSISLVLGRELNEFFTFEVGALYSDVNIYDAKDNKKRPITSYTGSLDGLSGAQIIALGGALEYNSLDSSYDPHSGTYTRFKIGYYEGIDGDEFGYTKYQFDMAEYFPVGRYVPFLYFDSVLALRLGAEFNDDINDDKIPFYDLARLGGGNSVRGYQYNRFFDENKMFYTLEYRYNIWSLKNYKVDATVFFDCGWIFDEISNVEFDQFKEGYGIGFRFIMPRFVVSLEGARSDEGTELYAKISPTF